MEGAAVAQVCHEMGGIPNAIIRVISDQADHSAAVDFLRFVDEVAEYLTGRHRPVALEFLFMPTLPSDREARPVSKRWTERLMP